MDVWGITLATLRRWYVFLPVMAVAVLLALQAGRSASPEYGATGSMLVTPPRVGSPIANPFVNAQGASEALTIILNGPETNARLQEAGFAGTVTVSSGSRSSVVTMRSVSPRAEDAVALIEAIVDIASDELVTRQRAAGIETDSLIGLQILAAPSITSVATDTAIRVQAVILAVGAVAGVTLAVLFDDIIGFIRRRRQRPAKSKSRSRRGSKAAVDPEPTDSEGQAESESESDPAGDTADAVAPEEGEPGDLEPDEEESEDRPSGPDLGTDQDDDQDDDGRVTEDEPTADDGASPAAPDARPGDGRSARSASSPASPGRQAL